MDWERGDRPGDDVAPVGVLSVGESGLWGELKSIEEGVNAGARNEVKSERPKSAPNDDMRPEDHSPSSLGGVDKDRRGGAIGARVTGEVGDNMPEPFGSLLECDDGV